MSEVTYMREVWLKRAKVASDCAAELEGLRSRLERVVTRNYFGVGCIEGSDLYTQLRTLVVSGVYELDGSQASARGLASASKAAADAIEAADAAAAGNNG